jgi:hypothetical protein
MSVVKLSIQARLCGPVSVGTVDVIKAVHLHAGLTLPEAKALVDRRVFEGETVTIAGLPELAADALVAGLRQFAGRSADRRSGRGPLIPCPR